MDHNDLHNHHSYCKFYTYSKFSSLYSKGKLENLDIDLVILDELHRAGALSWGKAVKYVPDDTMVMLPDGELGKTHVGVTPEESDLMNSLTADVSLVDGYIAVTTHKEHDPVTVEMKVSMVALPSFERANEIVIIDTITG